MKKLISLIIILSGLWGGYWFVGSSALQTGLKDYLKTAHGPRDAVHISYDTLEVRGFPNRFDSRATNITLLDKRNNIRWDAPYLQIYALSYKPYHIIAALPPKQKLHIGKHRLAISSDEIKGSVVFAGKSLLEKALIIERSSFVIQKLAVASNQGWQTSVKSANLAIRQTPLALNHYDLAISAKSITLPHKLRDLIDPKRRQKSVFDSFVANSTLHFTAPVNLIANGARLSDIKLNNLDAIWGDIKFQTEGHLKIDKYGYPEGVLNLTVTNWQQIYALANESGAVDPDFAPTIQNALTALASMSKGDDVIKAPLKFADRQITLGPFYIGPAPRLR